RARVCSLDAIAERIGRLREERGKEQLRCEEKERRSQPGRPRCVTEFRDAILRREPSGVAPIGCGACKLERSDARTGRSPLSDRVVGSSAPTGATSATLTQWLFCTPLSTPESLSSTPLTRTATAAASS